MNVFIIAFLIQLFALFLLYSAVKIREYIEKRKSENRKQILNSF